MDDRTSPHLYWSGCIKPRQAITLSPGGWRRYSISSGRVCVCVCFAFHPTVTAGSITPLSPSDMKLCIRSGTLRGCRAVSGLRPWLNPTAPFYGGRMAARGRVGWSWGGWGACFSKCGDGSVTKYQN